jgi:hypothetical protein
MTTNQIEMLLKLILYSIKSIAQAADEIKNIDEHLAILQS